MLCIHGVLALPACLAVVLPYEHLPCSLSFSLSHLQHFFLLFFIFFGLKKQHIRSGIDCVGTSYIDLEDDGTQIH